MKPLIQLTLLFSFLLFAGSASAALVTIDPDNYGHGTKVTSASPGVWLRAVSQHEDRHSTDDGIYVGDVYAVQGGACEFGELCDRPYASPGEENVFGWKNKSGGFGEWWYAGLYPDMVDFPEYADTFPFMGMMASFLEPTDYVSMASLSAADSTLIATYDIAGNRLDVTTAIAPYDPICCLGGDERIPYHLENFSLSRPQRDIAHVVIGGDSAASVLGKLTYSVPEPLNILLFGTGLMALGFRRRCGTANEA